MKLSISTLLLFLCLIQVQGCSSLSNTFGARGVDNLHRDNSCTIEDQELGKCACKKKHECYVTDSLVYAGTKDDAMLVALPFQYLVEDSDDKIQVLWIMPLVLITWPFAVVDLPLSAISDTLLYPYHKSKDKELINDVLTNE